MSRREIIREELLTLYRDGVKIATDFQKKQDQQFLFIYQTWYSKALKAVSSLAPDRYDEFRKYYEIDPKRKHLGYGTYVIQDFFKDVVPSRTIHPKFDERNETLKCFVSQVAIIHSIADRIDSVIANIETNLYSKIQDDEILVARQLVKISVRAAGALMGVVIEGHLQKVALNHGIKIGKKHPTISDLNEPLKAQGVIDTPTWRKITYMADLRNMCSHKKDEEPTKEQVEELIQGAEWLIKNLF